MWKSHSSAAVCLCFHAHNITRGWFRVQSSQSLWLFHAWDSHLHVCYVCMDTVWWSTQVGSYKNSFPPPNQSASPAVYMSNFIHDFFALCNMVTRRIRDLARCRHEEHKLAAGKSHWRHAMTYFLGGNSVILLTWKCTSLHVDMCAKLTRDVVHMESGPYGVFHLMNYVFEAMETCGILGWYEDLTRIKKLCAGVDDLNKNISDLLQTEESSTVVEKWWCLDNALDAVEASLKCAFSKDLGSGFDRCHPFVYSAIVQ